MNQLIENRTKLILCIEAAAHNTYCGEYSVIKEFIDFIHKDENNHFISFSFDDISKISFASKPQHKFDTDKRNKTTIRKYFRRNFCSDLSRLHDDALDDFGKNILVELSKLNKDLIEKRIKILESTAIEDFYEETTCGSCMTGSDMRADNFLLLYSNNPDKVKLVVLDDYVRALLWTCDDGTQVLDRVYPYNCDGVNLIREWAKSKGYILRNNPDRLVKANISTQLDNCSSKQITMKIIPDMNYPYLDTFKFGKFVDDMLILSNNIDFGNVVFINTDGGYLNKGEICYICGGLSNEDYDHDGNHYCEECFYEEFFICSECGDAHPIEESRSYDGNAYCLGCINQFAFRCCHCNEYTDNDELITTANGDEYCQYCADNCLLRCEDCEEYFPNDKIVEVDNKWVCENCLKDNYIVCEKCEEIVENCHSTVFDGKVYCDDCHCEFSCKFCDEHKNLQKIGEITVCEECASENHNVSYM